MGSPRSSELVPPEADRQTNTNGQHGDIFPPDGVRFGAPVDSCVLYPARAGRIDTCFYVTPPYGVFSGIYVFLSSRSRTYFAMSDILYMTMTIRYLVPGYIISLVSLSLHYMSRFYWWLGGRWWCRRLEEGEERIFLFFFLFFTITFNFQLLEVLPSAIFWTRPAVVTGPGVVPSPPRYVPSIFIAHRVQYSHCSSIFIECC